MADPHIALLMTMEGRSYFEQAENWFIIFREYRSKYLFGQFSVIYIYGLFEHTFQN